MGEALKEVGKHLLNLALAIAVYILIQPLLKGAFSLKAFLLGLVFYLILVALGILLIAIGDRLSNWEE